MPAFAPATHKLVTSGTSNLKDALRVDARDFLSRMFLDMGFSQVTIGNTAPSNKDVLWWHKDVRTMKRWDGVQGNWFALTANQYAMHLIRRAVLGSVADTNVETADLFMFWDVSLGELKVITRNDLASALLSALSTTEGVQGGGVLAAARTLKLDFSNLTEKALPKSVDLLALYSVEHGTHRKSTIEQVSASVAASDYLHSEMFFMGSF